MNNPLIAENQKVLEYVTRMEGIKEDWALFYRSSFGVVPDRGQHTNNIVERGFLRLKDNVLKRRKCMNVVQLAEFVTTKMTAKYQQVIFDNINHVRYTILSKAKHGLSLLLMNQFSQIWS